MINKEAVEKLLELANKRYKDITMRIVDNHHERLCKEIDMHYVNGMIDAYELLLTDNELMAERKMVEAGNLYKSFL